MYEYETIKSSPHEPKPMIYNSQLNLIYCVVSPISGDPVGGEGVQGSSWSPAQHQQVLYCIALYCIVLYSTSSCLDPHTDLLRLLYTGCSSLSILFLTITAAVYIKLPELNNLHGKIWATRRIFPSNHLFCFIPNIFALENFFS